MQILHTSFKKRKTKKPTAKQRELAAEWEAILKRHEPKRPIRATTTVDANYSPVVTRPYVRDTGSYRSLDTGLGVATLKESPRYTGTMIKGIGTMHKSNAVPIFTDEQAVEIATMRRG
jgi:hypothetical protein